MKSLKLMIRSLLVSSLLIGLLAGDGKAFRLIGVPASDGSYCLYPVIDCDDNEIFVRWFNYDVPYWVNEDAAQDAVNGTLTQTDVIGVTQASYQAWEDVPNSIIKFKYVGETSARVAVDGINNIVFYNAAQDAGDCAEANFGAEGGALAAAIITVVVASGEIIDNDILVDSAETWAWDDTCIFDKDIQHPLTHEVGHGIGIQHPENLDWTESTRPTMWFQYICVPYVSYGRTLEPDDEAAAQCLYPELPTLILLDETGSMANDGRLADMKQAANAFVDDFSSNLMAVAGFADAQDPCPNRPGYMLRQDWTQDEDLLHDAINDAFACGLTPLWEATCCAINKAMEEEPSNVLIFTDLEENTSDGDCGCSDFDDVLMTAEASEVVIYAIDMSSYVGSSASQIPTAETDPTTPAAGDDGPALSFLCEQTGGLYFKVFSESQLLSARLDIERHLAENGKARQNPPGCNPGPYPIDEIQQYTAADCLPDSPHDGELVTVTGVVTAERGTFDLATQYIEDCSGGLQLFGTVGPTALVGDVIEAVGVINTFFGEIRMDPVIQYVIVGSDDPPVPSIVPPGTGHFCEMVGSLMTVAGFVDGPVVDDRFQLVLDPDLPLSPRLIVYIDPDTGIDTDAIEPGQFYNVTGVLRRNFPENELMPRGQFDLVLDVSDTGPEESLGLTGLSGIRLVRPNPSSGRAEITYAVSNVGPVRLEILDVQGRVVRRLVDGIQPSAMHTARWDGRNNLGAESAAGIYFVRLAAPGAAVDTRRLLILK